jgi:hypothetical protein
MCCQGRISGKITYQEGDFSEETIENNLVAAIVLEYCEN